MEMTITIDGMRLYAYHGVMEQERRVGNMFEVSVSLTYHVDNNTEITDSLAGTINYAEVAEIIGREMSVPSQLLEHVAARIRTSLLQAFPQATSGHVRVEKTTPPLTASIRSASATLSW